MARRQHIALCAVVLVAVAQGAFAGPPTKPTDSKTASQPQQKPKDKLKPEAAPQQPGLLLPTGQPGLPLFGMPAAAATDPRSVKPVAGLPAGLPALAPPQPAALPGAFPGALPSMAAPMQMPGAFPAAAGGFPAAAGAAAGYPAATYPAGYPQLAPGFPAAATTGPLMPAPLQAMPAPMLPTSMPGDGVMGLGGPPVIPGVTPNAGISGSDMANSGSYDSAFGSSVGSLGMGGGIGGSADPFTSTSMGGSGTLGASAAGTLGMGANADASQALRSRRAATNNAAGSKLATGLAGVALLACVMLL